VFGVGAVGGYYGGKLAVRYEHSRAVEIIFLAKPGRARLLEAQGLKVATPEGEFVARPALVASDGGKAGLVDLILCCVKGYDLDGVAGLAPCLTEATIILPLQNGLDAQERIATILPRADVWRGCVYVVSRLIAPGEVRMSGTLDEILFGSETAGAQALEGVEQLLRSAGINARRSDHMRSTIWEKFFFLSSIATLTSYFDADVGGILKDPCRIDLLKELLGELGAVAEAEGIDLPSDVAERTFAKIAGLPPETTSSMRTDFQRGRATELDAITGVVTELGRARRVPTPRYSMILAQLRARTREGGM
jgi:2-dehydropantoate 2-reductase